MAVLGANDYGWIISHELYVRRIYEKTTGGSNGPTSYFFKPDLFDIQIPFVKGKSAAKGNNSTRPVLTGDVKTVKEAHDNLYELYKSICDGSVLREESNRSAKSLADNFYCKLTRHPDYQFNGGNHSREPLVTDIGNEEYLIPGDSVFYCYDIRDISKHLTGRQFDLILMDPPWWNKYIRRKRKKDSKYGYDMVYDQELANIPIGSLLDSNGIVGVWCTSAPSHINAILKELFPKWNVKYVTQWFWLKVTKLGKPVCDFSETLGKQPFERLILGVQANSSRSGIDNLNGEKVVMSVPSAVHSHKPPLCELLKPWLPNEPRCLELFARYLLPSWTSYGNEVLKLQHVSLYSQAPGPESPVEDTCKFETPDTNRADKIFSQRTNLEGRKFIFMYLFRNR